MFSDVSVNVEVRISRISPFHKNTKKTQNLAKVARINFFRTRGSGINQRLTETRGACSQEKLLNLRENSKFCSIVIYFSLSLPQFTPYFEKQTIFLVLEMDIVSKQLSLIDLSGGSMEKPH